MRSCVCLIWELSSDSGGSLNQRSATATLLYYSYFSLSTAQLIYKYLGETKIN